MNKFAVACAAAALMSLAACGEKPAAEANNASNEAVANAIDNSGERDRQRRQRDERCDQRCGEQRRKVMLPA